MDMFGRQGKDASDVHGYLGERDRTFWFSDDGLKPMAVSYCLGP